MRRHRLSLLAFLISFLFILSCQNSNIIITGDIALDIKFKDIKQLKQICEQNNIDEIYIQSQDDLVVGTEIRSLDKLILLDNAFTSLDDTLPETVKVRNVIKIILKKKREFNSVAFFDSTYQVAKYNPSDIRLYHFEERGRSQKNGYKIKKYGFDMYPRIFFRKISDSLLVIYKNGLEDKISKDEYKTLLKRENIESIIKDSVVVIWNNPPPKSIYQINSQINRKLQENKKVLAVFIDGLGYYLLENAGNKKKLSPNLKFQPMTSVYPPVTKVAYYAFGTGKHLNQAGNYQGIFPNLTGDQYIFIEEDKTYHNPSGKLILCLDENHNGLIDDDIYYKAKDTISQGHPKMVFVHFHSIDDFAHQYSPYNPKTVDQVELVLNWVEDLCRNWDGEIILFSDHGLHGYEKKDGTNGGSHGKNEIEDFLALEGIYEKN